MNRLICSDEDAIYEANNLDQRLEKSFEESKGPPGEIFSQRQKKKQRRLAKIAAAATSEDHK